MSHACDVAPRQAVGVFVAADAGMPLAPCDRHVRVLVEQEVKRLPKRGVGDLGAARARVRIDSLPAVVAPYHSPRMTTFDDMMGVRPEDGCSSRPRCCDPGESLNHGFQLEGVVRPAVAAAVFAVNRQAAFEADEAPSSRSGRCIKRAVREDVALTGRRGNLHDVADDVANREDQYHAAHLEGHSIRLCFSGCRL